MRQLGLLRSLFGTKLEGFKSMEEYVTEVISISQQLVDISVPVEEEFIGDVLLSGLSPEYNPVIMALENLGVKITSDFIKSKLIQKDLRWKTEQDTNETALLFNSNKLMKSSG
jgi:glutamine amidotransferase-like uncharacterized protein